MIMFWLPENYAHISATELGKYSTSTWCGSLIGMLQVLIKDHPKRFHLRMVQLHQLQDMCKGSKNMASM